MSGEIVLATREKWQRMLRDLVAGNQRAVHLELSAVSFVDVCGATALVAASHTLEEGSRIVLHRPPSSLQRLLEVLWPNVSAVEVARQ